MLAAVCRTIRLPQDAVGQFARFQARNFPRLALDAVTNFPMAAVPAKIVRPNSRFGQLRNVLLFDSKAGAFARCVLAIFDSECAAMRRDAVVGMIASSYMRLRCDVMFVARMSATKAKRG